MKLLFWKDYRLSRVILLAGVLLALSPYLFADGFRALDAGWTLSAFLSQFTMALLAGNIIACERADRSAEFLAFQGASRITVVISKGLFCLLVFAVINTLMVVSREAILLTPDPYSQRLPRWYMANLQFGAATTGLALWGCCWLLSSFLERPAVAVLVGIPVPALVVFVLNHGDWNQRPNTYWYCYGGTCSAIGTACFIAGTYYYVRRREP
jgi:ABC-type transport system involved in multi-copper enzyme maturation permease subunit